MKRVNKFRFREREKLEDERSSVMQGMILLVHAQEHLKLDVPCPGVEAAMAEIDSIAGTLEGENKDLCEKSQGLWETILASDGLELSSVGIAKEQQRVDRGIEKLQSIRKHVGAEVPGETLEEGLARIAAVRIVAEADDELIGRRTELRIEQQNFQLARAKALLKSGRS